MTIKLKKTPQFNPFVIELLKKNGLNSYKLTLATDGIIDWSRFERNQSITQNGVEVLANVLNVPKDTLLSLLDVTIINDTIFAKNLGYLRHKHRYSQKNIGDALGIGADNISRYETGNRAVPIHNLEKIAKFLNVDSKKLSTVDIEEEENRNK